jgi:hypothetical protein
MKRFVVEIVIHSQCDDSFDKLTIGDVETALRRGWPNAMSGAIQVDAFEDQSEPGATSLAREWHSP